MPSISVTYSKPASISAVASLMLLAALQVHSSSFRFSVQGIGVGYWKFGLACWS
jgi:hypothetical protein